MCRIINIERQAMPTVSLIATVLNEGQSIRTLLESLRGQLRPPDEVVIVDGGSSDGTYEFLTSQSSELPFPLRASQAPGCNISEGRNLAINNASGEVIAVTDAGVRLHPAWLESLVAPFDQPQAPDVSCGFFESEPHSFFEWVLGAITLPRVDEIDPATFAPSSRSVAFRKAAWQAVGGYPEWLDYCEDLIYDFRLRDAGFRFSFSPQAMVGFRSRKNLKAFFKQYYRYARGDGKADLYFGRHLLRYGVYLGLIPATIALAVAVHPLFWLLLIPSLTAILWRAFKRLLPELCTLGWGGRLHALAWLPVICVTGDVAKMLGYPVGVVWRCKHKPPLDTRKRHL